MKAIGYTRSLPSDDPDFLVACEVPEPEIGAHDLLVEVEAVSVNPVDTKVRMRAAPEQGHKILGYDAAGTVRAVGSAVTRFAPGDKVFYAGDITREGTNAALHAVDERIVGRTPSNLSMTEAAALPLTAITAWELLFDSFKIAEGGGEGDAILVIGGAGGVGSILIQLARALTGLRVIATASREETRDWCRKMGAHDIVSHREPLAPQLAALGVKPRYVAALTATDQHFNGIVELIAPRGEIGMIDDPDGLDIMKIKRKSLSFHIEFMFARSMWQTPDMDAQHRLLTRVAELVEAGRIRTTMTEDFGPMTVDALKAAHRRQESGAAIGKGVLGAIA